MEKIKDAQKNNSSAATATVKPNPRKSRTKTLKGVVLSNKMQKTVVVLTKRFVKHPKYEKYQTIAKKYKAHVADEKQHEIGSVVIIEECAPISKEKRFRVVAAETDASRPSSRGVER